MAIYPVVRKKRNMFGTEKPRMNPEFEDEILLRNYGIPIKDKGWDEMGFHVYQYQHSEDTR